MASTPSRRSPRSIERILNGTLLPGMSVEQTAMLFALSHCTGWCADRIANKFKKITGIELEARQVWDAHGGWITSRGGDILAEDDVAVMQVLLQNAEVNISTFGPPLNQTTCPQTVKFTASYSPANGSFMPLFAGFTAQARQHSKMQLSFAGSRLQYGKLTSTERALVAPFGNDMALIFRDVLKRWARAMRTKLRHGPPLKPVRDIEHVRVIMDYLKIFEHEYESKFGKMEEDPSSQPGEIFDDTVYITSTGYGAKLFLGLIMADRLHVIDMKRKSERAKIGFTELDISRVKDDSKDCPICQDRMGVANPEGIKETPIEMTICCGQVLGRQCLQKWLSEFAYGKVFRDTCPICRFKFPEIFIAKLFPKDQYLARLARQEAMISPSPTPAE